MCVQQSGGCIPNKPLLTTGDVAKYCKVSFPTVHHWIKKGHLKAFQNPGIGNHRIDLQDFLDFLAEHNMPIPEELQDQSPRVLIVDDEVPVANAIRRQLRRAGFETEIAFDGFQAGRLLESYAPTVLTLDLDMPGLKGLDVIKQVRSSPKLDGLKILIVSAMPQVELDAALAAGADDILEKPFENKILVEKVSQLAGILLDN